MTETNNLTRKFKSLTYIELIKLINKEKIIIIDLRKSEDFENGHIINSLNLNLDSIEDKEFNKEQVVVTYSDVESDSISAAKEYVKLGHETVYYLQGGIQSWVENNMPLTGNEKNG
tara:strand:+ start:133 stop:480 length:348 start_codon:yes stop_codon:yes gene_type:complete